MLLLRGYNTLSARGRDRLEVVLAADDPTGELGAAWGVKEALRLILACPTIAAARAAKARFDAWVAIAATDETDRFAATITAWWPAIEVTIATGVTNARTEAANTAIKHIKRTGRGYRNSDHYQTRILLRVACQRDGTTVLPRAWDHLEVLVSMADLVSGVNGDAPALPVGGAFDDEGVGS